MNLKDYLNLIRKLKVESKNSDFFYAIIDASMRKPYRNETIENPLSTFYESDETIRGICNGTKHLSRKCASAIYNLYDKDNMMKFIYNRTDNFSDFKDALLAAGFEIEINEENDEDIPSTLANLFALIIENISKGIYETVPSQNESTGNLETDAFKKAYIKDHCLHISNQIIELPKNITWNGNTFDCDLPYVIELLKVYSEFCGTPINSIEELKLHPDCNQHFHEQSRCYYSAEAMRRSVRDLFTDGEENFNILKDEIYDSIYETYIDLSLKDGYQRLKNVLEMVTKADLNSTILLNIKGLVNIKERKGICHILVNEGKIKSWVEVSYE